MALNYKQLISKVIEDFNKVQDAIGSKEISAEYVNSSSGLLATNTFGATIRNYLIFPKNELPITEWGTNGGIHSVVSEVTSGDATRTGYATIKLSRAEFGKLTGEENTDGTYTVKGAGTVTTQGWTLTSDNTDEDNYLTIPKATFNRSGANFYTSTEGYIKAGFLTDLLLTMPSATFNSKTSITNNTVSIDTDKTLNTSYTNIKNYAFVRSGIDSLENGDKYIIPIKYTGSVNPTALTEGFISQGGSTSTVEVDGSGYVVIKPVTTEAYKASTEIIKKDASSGETKNITNIITASATTAPNNGNYYISLVTDSTDGGVNITEEGYATSTDAKAVGVIEDTRYFTIKSAQFKTAPESGLNHADYDYNEENKVAAGADNDGNYWLYINAGYLPNTRLSLGDIIPDIDGDYDITNLNNGSKYLLTGYSAYDENGKVINGTMPNLNIANNHKYFTTDTTISKTDSKLTTGSYVDKDYYIRLGSVTPAGTISETNSANVTQKIANNVITLEATIENTPVVSAGWIDSGTAGATKVTLSSNLETTEQTAGAGHCDFKAVNVNAAPTTYKNAAVLLTDAPSDGNYVTVSATGYGYVKINKAGYIGETTGNGTKSNTSSATNAYIKATENPNLEVDTVKFTSTGSIFGTATSFDIVNGEGVKSHTSATKTVTLGFSGGSTNNQFAAYKDNYIIGVPTVMATGEDTVTLHEDATGVEVDNYLLALFNRMSGLAYNDLID